MNRLVSHHPLLWHRWTGSGTKSNWLFFIILCSLAGAGCEALPGKQPVPSACYLTSWSAPGTFCEICDCLLKESMALPLPLGGLCSAFSKARVSFSAGIATKRWGVFVTLLVPWQCLRDQPVRMTQVPRHWENILVSLVGQAASTFLSVKGNTTVLAHTADSLVSSAYLSPR